MGANASYGAPGSTCICGRSKPLRRTTTLQIVPKSHGAYRNPECLGSARYEPAGALIFTFLAQTSRKAVTAQYEQVAGLLRSSLPQVVDMPTQAEPDLTAFAALPREHRPTIWFNSPIEHSGREIKRRAAVVQVFPDQESGTCLIGAVLLEQHEEWQYRERRSLSKTSLGHLIHMLHQDQHPLPDHHAMTVTA